MKRIYDRVLFAGIIFCIALQVFGQPTVYGIENAVTYSKPIKKPTYLQAGSFTQQKNAQNYQHQLQKSTPFPVIIVHKKERFSVIIGPVNSLQDLHQVANAILNTKSIEPGKPSNNPIQQNPSTSSVKIVPAKATISQLHLDKDKLPVTVTKDSRASTWYASVGIGGGSIGSDSSMTVNNGSEFPNPYNLDTYSVNNIDSSTLFFLSGGKRWLTNKLWFPSYSLGLYYQYLMPTEISGTISEYSSAEFTNYNYQWKFSTNVLMASAKLNIVNFNQLMPYISAGIGGAFNHTSGFEETALPGITARVSPGFKSNNNSQFAYQFGLGLDFQPLDNLLLALGYQYQYLGDIQSGEGTSQWSNTQLFLKSIDSNQILASASYLFNF